MQVKKDDIINKIIKAATRSFRDLGYTQTSMAKIAQEAGISTGNIYHYFKSKEDLFEAVLPEEFASSFRHRLIKATRLTFGHSNLTKDDPSLRNYWKSIEELLLTSSDEKDRLLILLAQAEGTAFEHFRNEVIGLMAQQALKYAVSIDPSFKKSPDMLYLVREIYNCFLITITHILADSRSPREALQRLSLLRTYHLNGLRALFQGGNL